MSFKRPLYDVLGVPQDAVEGDISRVYRRLALQYHPDRNPNGETKFKEIANAYSVLGDSEKRRVYDATGVIPGVASEENSEATMAERSAEMKERVRMFYATYAGSPEETEDVMSCYNKCKGNFRRMAREELLFDNRKEDEIWRLRELVRGLVENGSLQPTEAWKLTSSEAVVKQVMRALRKERKEAADALDGMGLSAEKNGGDLHALQALMRQDQKAEWGKMMSSLESKYLQPKGATKGAVQTGTKKKRKAEATQRATVPPRKKARN
ncbi:chaperone DnaJ protein [Trypanosoma rangeli]|uniref:Chaperone DnaJ protein n=1 Tax=Trypanosoma rangeli TaxID=5698 RepID=A0A3S5ISR2_TRYRA|nr:chaperone DnaJ protein [Trypanosoma rangeli]RNF12871.1 chaperone DnaJ protein [Trypanosoma rangeli]|eukprot:RNF12871.1 chaperone DnaJ protein [Trypanosoma rangeli]